MEFIRFYFIRHFNSPEKEDPLEAPPTGTYAYPIF